MKDIARIFCQSAKSRLYKKSHFNLVLKDIFGSYGALCQNIDHLKDSIEWLKRAQDFGGDGGVSAGYSMRGGWLRSYPETTGYIIVTFLDYFDITKKKEYLDRAVLMADWLVSVQLENGAFQGGFLGGSLAPIVFNTGQALQGLAAIYRHSGDNKYLISAKRAADWLVSVQGGDGSWKNFTYNDIATVYHSRVAWPLIEFFNLEKDGAYIDAASKNIEWAISNQLKDGWFDNNAFDLMSNPPLHTIAYAIEGILNGAILTKKDNWRTAAVKAVDALLADFERSGSLAAFYGRNWQRMASSRCLTGEAQTAICLFKLFETSKKKRYLDAALKINSGLKKLQDHGSDNLGIRGGVKGSHPVWGNYLSFTYPNWAVKFFCDALILERKLKNN